MAILCTFHSLNFALSFLCIFATIAHCLFLAGLSNFRCALPFVLSCFWPPFYCQLLALQAATACSRLFIAFASEISGKLFKCIFISFSFCSAMFFINFFNFYLLICVLLFLLLPLCAQLKVMLTSIKFMAKKMQNLKINYQEPSAKN